MTDSLFVYSTAPSFEDAHEIALAVVGEGLAACVNILPPIASVYRFNDTVQEEKEIAFILKTTAAAFDALAAKIREMHPYDCPCIIALPIAAGQADYLDWLRQSVPKEKKEP